VIVITAVGATVTRVTITLIQIGWKFTTVTEVPIEGKTIQHPCHQWTMKVIFGHIVIIPRISIQAIRLTMIVIETSISGIIRWRRMATAVVKGASLADHCIAIVIIFACSRIGNHYIGQCDADPAFDPSCLVVASISCALRSRSRAVCIAGLITENWCQRYCVCPVHHQSTVVCERCRNVILKLMCRAVVAGDCGKPGCGVTRKRALVRATIWVAVGACLSLG